MCVGCFFDNRSRARRLARVEDEFLRGRDELRVGGRLRRRKTTTQSAPCGHRVPPIRKRLPHRWDVQRQRPRRVLARPTGEASRSRERSRHELRVRFGVARAAGSIWAMHLRRGSGLTAGRAWWRVRLASFIITDCACGPRALCPVRCAGHAMAYHSANVLVDGTARAPSQAVAESSSAEPAAAQRLLLLLEDQIRGASGGSTQCCSRTVIFAVEFQGRERRSTVPRCGRSKDDAWKIPRRLSLRIVRASDLWVLVRDSRDHPAAPSRAVLRVGSDRLTRSSMHTAVTQPLARPSMPPSGTLRVTV